MKNIPHSVAGPGYGKNLRAIAALATLLWSALLGASLAWNIFAEQGHHEPIQFHHELLRLNATHGLIWLVGLAAIAAFTRRGERCLKTQRAIVDELRLLARVFQEGNHAVMIVAPDTTLLRVNPAFTELTGYAAEEVLGRKGDFLKPPDHDPKFFAALRETLMETGKWQGEIWSRHKSGDLIALAYSISTIRDANGKPLYYLCEMRNITRRKEQEEALLRLNDELEHRVEQRTEQLLAAKHEAERANHAKTEFLSRMSHELRTPLNAIIGFSQLLESDDAAALSASQRENVDEILHAGRHLLELINEVLDLARIESGRMELFPEPVVIGELLGECLSLVRPLADKRGITLDSSVSSQCGMTCIISADRLRLRQALLNLLSNAIKYNRDGGRVEIRCNSDERMIRFGIADTGRGIAPENLPRLFLPFERIDSAYAGIEGTGIGLALTHRIVHAMGGSLSVESTPGKGSIFWIDIPRVAAPCAAGCTAT